MKNFSFLFVVAIVLSSCFATMAQSQQSSGSTYQVTVNYDMNLKQMVEIGRYDWPSNDITAKRFPLSDKKGKVETQLQIVHLSRKLTTKQVLSELDARGLRPATLWELLAFGSKYPNLQKKFPIVALGSHWKTENISPRYPALHSYATEDGVSKRTLILYWCATWSGWGKNDRFLAVPK